jgi:hypothetical protein
LKANLTTARHQKWLEWISGASSLRNRFLDEEGYDPFDFNETASVSLLASAAVHIGGLALAESISTKRKQEDYRKKGHGRDDLYILLGDQGWTFEFKQIFRPITSQLKGQFDAACRCARQTDTLDGERGVAGLIVFTADWYVEHGRLEKYAQNVIDFCKQEDKVKFAVSIGTENPKQSRCFILCSDPF